MIKISIPKMVSYILKVLNNKGYEAYIVGGCVRDSLLNRVPKDWDITTNALPEEVIDIFNELGHKTIPTGLKHGTVTVVLEEENYEITTYRIDGEYSDNRHPDKVTFTPSLKEDLKRRDFTINAMAYNYELVDYFGGVEDLENKVINSVGEAEHRFNEDSLRMLRAVRFAAQLDFKISSSIISTIPNKSDRLKNISNERIRDEFCKILLSNKAAYGLWNLADLKLLEYIIPELIVAINFNQHNYHHDKDVFKHTLAVVENTKPMLDLRLAALLHDIGKPKCFTLDEEGMGHFYNHAPVGAEMAKKILIRMKIDNKTIDTVYKLIDCHMIPTNLNDKSVKRLIKKVGQDNIYKLFDLIIADRKATAEKYRSYEDVLLLKYRVDKILNEKQPMTVKELHINGIDLMELGISEGPQIGMVLDKLLDIVLEEPEFNNREYLINYVEENFM